MNDAELIALAALVMEEAVQQAGENKLRELQGPDSSLHARLWRLL